MRYFTFNFVARRYSECGDNQCVRESVANEINLISKTFPSRDEIFTAIDEAFENLEDVTITHKFEYKCEEDFRNYIGDNYIERTS